MSKVERAKELASLISDILGKSDVRLILYTKDLDSDSKARIEHLINRDEVAISSFNFDEDGSAVDPYVFINVDKAIEGTSKEDFTSLCHYLAIEPTATNRFIFVLLHQLGHCWQASLLGQVGQAPLLKKVRIALDATLPQDFKDGELGDILNPESLFSDFYATSTIHRVLKDLELIDVKYLTYLD